MELKLLFLFLLSCSCQGSPCGDKDDCVKRVDEELREDYSSVVPCDIGYPVLGLICGDKCLATSDWCSALPISTDCGGFTIDDAKLCQNYTFWHNQDCNQYDEEGRVASYGRRCTGQMMGCNYPAYMRENYDYNWPCSDKSDQIHKIGSKCTIEQHLDIYKRLFCNQNPEARRGEYCDEIQSDPAGWISKQTDQDNLDPHNCQASCLTPDYGCDACTKRDYFRCPVHGTESCLHPDLECDGQPQCDNAEDEDFWKCLLWSIKTSFSQVLTSSFN